MALTAQDVEPIAREQIAQEDAAMSRASKLTIHDTDLLSTVIYARHYYQALSRLDRRYRALSRAQGLYLLCDIDLPWVSDGLLRDRGMGRATSAVAFTFRHDVEANRPALDIYTGYRPWPVSNTQLPPLQTILPRTASLPAMILTGRKWTTRF